MIFDIVFEWIMYLLLGLDVLLRLELDTACDFPGLLNPPGFSPLKTFWTASDVSISLDITLAKAYRMENKAFYLQCNVYKMLFNNSKHHNLTLLTSYNVPVGIHLFLLLLDHWQFLMVLQIKAGRPRQKISNLIPT